jgi:hypothetical protein
MRCVHRLTSRDELQGSRAFVVETVIKHCVTYREENAMTT